MKPRFQVPLADLGQGNRLILEMASDALEPVTRELATHLDDVRTMLLRGSIGPAKAHVLLLKAVRLNREKLLGMIEASR